MAQELSCRQWPGVNSGWQPTPFYLIWQANLIRMISLHGCMLERVPDIRTVFLHTFHGGYIRLHRNVPLRLVGLWGRGPGQEHFEKDGRLHAVYALASMQFQVVRTHRMHEVNEVPKKREATCVSLCHDYVMSLRGDSLRGISPPALFAFACLRPLKAVKPKGKPQLRPPLSPWPWPWPSLSPRIARPTQQPCKLSDPRV